MPAETAAQIGDRRQPVWLVLLQRADHVFGKKVYEERMQRGSGGSRRQVQMLERRDSNSGMYACPVMFASAWITWRAAATGVSGRTVDGRAYRGIARRLTTVWSWHAIAMRKVCRSRDEYRGLLRADSFSSSFVRGLGEVLAAEKNKTTDGLLVDLGSRDTS